MGSRRGVVFLVLAGSALLHFATAAYAAIECSVTIPNREPLPPGYGAPPSNDGAPPGGGGYLHGNGSVWSWLPEDGVHSAEQSQVQSDGSIEVKWYWWRRVESVGGEDVASVGPLRLEGRRIDAPAPPVQMRVHPYNEGSFQGSRVVFPGPGCYQLTGGLDAEALTFTVLILTSDQPPADASPDTAMGLDDLTPPIAPLGALTLLLVGLLVARRRIGRGRCTGPE